MNDEFAMYIYDNVKDIKGCVHIVHGMNEHIGRYQSFAKFLNSIGYLVVGIDALGHGLSADKVWMQNHGAISNVNDKYGYFGENGFARIIAGMLSCHTEISKMYHIDKYILFGHSMGTILVGNFLIEHGSLIDKVILSGVVLNPKKALLLKAAAIYAKLLKPEGYSKFIYRMSNGSFDKKLQKKIGKIGWLSHDHAIIEAYSSDPYCQFRFTNNAYFELFKAMEKIIKTSKITFEKNFLLVSGCEDASGDFGEIPKQLQSFYENISSGNVELILYENMRHELVNCKDAKRVYDDIEVFLNKK